MMVTNTKKTKSALKKHCSVKHSKKDKKKIVAWHDSMGSWTVVGTDIWGHKKFNSFKAWAVYFVKKDLTHPICVSTDFKELKDLILPKIKKKYKIVPVLVSPI